jgi:hypothetical protein
MRFAAQKTIHLQDMLPADGSVYYPNMDNKMSSIMDALKAWEKKRGLSFSFKSKFIENRAKKTEPAKENTKAKPATDLPVEAPRARMKPGRRPQFTKEEKRQRKNENNRLYRIKKNAEARARSKKWRDNLTPEQRQAIKAKAREWRANRKVQRAADLAAGGGTAGMPLANPAV